MSYTNKYLITNGIESAEDVNSGTKETWYCPSALFSITAPMALAQDYDPCLRLHGHVYTFLLGKSELKFENKFFLLEFPYVLILAILKAKYLMFKFFCLFICFNLLWLYNRFTGSKINVGTNLVLLLQLIKQHHIGRKCLFLLYDYSDYMSNLEIPSFILDCKVMNRLMDGHFHGNRYLNLEV